MKYNNLAFIAPKQSSPVLITSNIKGFLLNDKNHISN
jgi:hypothetical protein